MHEYSIDINDNRRFLKSQTDFTQATAHFITDQLLNVGLFTLALQFITLPVYTGPPGSYTLKKLTLFLRFTAMFASLLELAVICSAPAALD
jgi:hypothetical protein